MAEHDATWLFGVCKRVAALTRDVFALHSETIVKKNRVSELHTILEDELARAMEISTTATIEMDNHVTKYKEYIDTIIRHAYDSELSKTKRQFEGAIETIDAQRRDIVEKVSNCMTNIQTMLKDIQDAFDSQKTPTQIEAELARIEESVLERISSKQKDILARHVNKANKEYNELVMAAAKAEEEIRAEHEKNMDDLRKQLLSEQESEVAAALERQRQLEMSFREIENGRDAIQHDIDELKLHFISSIEEIEKKVSSYEKEKQAKTASFCEEMAETKATLHALQTELEGDLAETEKEGASEKAKIEQELLALTEKYENEKARIENELANLEATATSFSEGARAKIEALMVEHKSAVDGIRKELSWWMSHMKEKKVDVDDETKRARDKHGTDLDKIRSEMSNVKEKYDLDLAKLMQSQESELAAVREEHESQEEGLRHELQSNEQEAKLTAEDTHKKVQDLKQQIQDTKQKFQLENEASEKEFSAKIELLKRESAKWMKEFESSSNEGSKKDITAHDQEIRDLRARYESQKVELTSEYQKKTLQETEALKQYLFSDREKEMQTIRKEKDEIITQIELEIMERENLREKAKTTLAQEIAAKEAMILKLTHEVEDVSKTWNLRKQKIDSEKSSKLTTDNSNNVEEERQAEFNFNQAIASHDKEVACLQEKLSESVKESERLRQDLDNHVKTLQNNNSQQQKEIEAQIQSNKTKWNSALGELHEELNRIKSQHQEDMSTVTGQHQDQMNDMKSRLNELQRMNSQRHEETLKNHSEKRKSIEEEIDQMNSSLQQKIDAMRHGLTTLRQDHERAISKMHEDMKNDVMRVTSENEQLQDTLRRSQEESNATLQQLQSELQQKQQKLVALLNSEGRQIQENIRDKEKHRKDQVTELETELSEWQTKFENRDARPEDLEAIARLQASLKEKKEALDKLEKELKYYRTELLNREKTFNQIFSAKPSHSVLSTLERKMKQENIMASVQLPSLKR